MQIEPHKHILKKPRSSTLLFKFIEPDNFLNMVKNNYLYFKRIDTYNDDIRDGDIPDGDKLLCENAKFQKAPNFSLYDYYCAARSKSYACCLTKKITRKLWNKYGNNNPNSVCLVFSTGKLIEYLNNSLNNARICVNGKSYYDFFWINYGIVEYINFDEQYMLELFPNPTKYSFLKRLEYSNENEFRILISCNAIYKYFLPNGVEYEFKDSIKIEFNFLEASKNNVIDKILVRKDCSGEFIKELATIFKQKSIQLNIERQK